MVSASFICMTLLKRPTKHAYTTPDFDTADIEGTPREDIEREIRLIRELAMSGGGAEGKAGEGPEEEWADRAGDAAAAAAGVDVDEGDGDLSDDVGSDSPKARILTQDEIHDIFDFYCNFGRSAIMTYQDAMDSFMFMKFARECPGLLDDGALTRTEIDLIFTKAKRKFERRLDFEHFLDALSAIAEKKYPECEPAMGLRLLISNHLAPHYDIVREEMTKTGATEVPLKGIFKRLYDPRK